MDLRGGRGFTLIELLIVVAIIGIIAAIGVPELLRARMSANEASAVGSMRAINSSQHAFSSSCANGFFAQAFTDLQAPPGGAPFLSPDLLTVAPTKSGYDFSMVAGTDALPGVFNACNGVLGSDLVGTYVARANPVAAGTTGSRYFWTSTLGTIYFDPTGAIAHTEGGTIPPVSAPAGPLQ